jgi:hypothetical protein
MEMNKNRCKMEPAATETEEETMAAMGLVWLADSVRSAVNQPGQDTCS